MDDYEADTTRGTGPNSRLGRLPLCQVSSNGLFLNSEDNAFERIPHLLANQLQQGGARRLIGTARNPFQAGT
ncbi:hypothetical protein [Microbulbifer variabilis]|uniref:hypothetical protein n=1 Tax=Microbulbifer variabilis TaxID=266805 RepID=UPI001CFE85BB|nr:hypothetical protein [Microbulbifer variabilis]